MYNNLFVCISCEFSQTEHYLNFFSSLLIAKFCRDKYLPLKSSASVIYDLVPDMTEHSNICV